jgi:hypothetical protein
MPTPIVNIVGKKYGRLTVIRFLGVRKGRGTWECQCECGNVTNVITDSLNSGNTKSCGCIQKDFISKRMTTHGYCKNHEITSEYKSWSSMNTRCYNEKATGYEDYGGRGIQVCERWKNSFENFIADMGPKPTKNHSIDRFPDNDGNYEPTNCRWATDEQQRRNKRNNRWVEYKGEVMLAADFKKLAGVTSQRFLSKLDIGWSTEEIEKYYFNKKQRNVQSTKH